MSPAFPSRERSKLPSVGKGNCVNRACLCRCQMVLTPAQGSDTLQHAFKAPGQWVLLAGEEGKQYQFKGREETR